MRANPSVTLSGLAAVALLAGFAGAANAASGFVNTTVNLREGPSTTTAIIGKIPAGTAIEVTGCSGEWCQIAFGGKHGYVIATALGAPGHAPAAPPPGYGPPPPGYGPPPPPPVYVVPGPYYGPYYYGHGWGWRRGWRHW